MAAPTVPSPHGVLKSSASAAGGEVWGGRFSFTTAGGVGAQQASITDSNFTSRIIRSSNHIILTSGNGSASRIMAGFLLDNSTTNTFGTGIWCQMTNNATILVNYHNYANGAVPMFFFMVFAGGTTT